MYFEGSGEKEGKVDDCIKGRFAVSVLFMFRDVHNFNEWFCCYFF